MPADLDALRRAAEAEMARPAPDRPPAKRRRLAGGAEAAGRSVGRYDYAAARDVRGPAFLISCAFRREKSAAQEAAAVLRCYLQLKSSNSSSSGAQAADVPGCQQGAIEAPDGSAGISTPHPALQPLQTGSPAGGGASGVTSPGMCRTDGGAGCSAAAGPASTAQAEADSDVSEHPDVTGAGDSSRQGCAMLGPVGRVAGGAEPAAAERQPTGDGGGGGGSNGGSAALAVVKLGVSGLMLLQAPDLAPGAVTAAVGVLLADIAGGRKAPLEHCRRIVPVEVIAQLEESALAAAAQSAAAVFLRSTAAAQLPRPCSYAVAYKHRHGTGGACPAAAGTSTSAAVATDAAEAAGSAAVAAVPVQQAGAQSEAPQRQPEAAGSRELYGGGAGNRDPTAETQSPADGNPELGRQDAIRVMAAAAAAAAEAAGLEAVVNLRRPDWAVVAETLPVAGSSKGLIGVAAVPAAMLTFKPKLQVAATSATGT